MAQHFTDFEPDALGAQPANTSLLSGAVGDFVVVSDASASNGKALKQASSNNSMKRLSFTALAGSGVSEVFARLKHTDQQTGQTGSVATDFGAGVSEALSGSGHVVGDFILNTDLRLAKNDPGFSVLTAGFAFQEPFNEYFFLRFRREKTTDNLIQFRAWLDDGSLEPTTWLEAPAASLTFTEAVASIYGYSNSDVFYDYIGIGTDGDPAPTAAAATPAITDINTNETVTPGATATLTGTALTGATGINIGSVAQTGFTVVNDTTVTFTGTRGGNPYNQNLTATLLHPDGNATITVQQVPATGFAVTAASPNTTDDASLWSGLVDTSTGNPVTPVDGDQALVTDPNNLGNLAVTPSGEISADTTGNFTVQFWQLSEGVWGGDQTVSFTLPDTDNWPFPIDTPSIPITWEWGGRHPKTGARVRLFKRG